MSLLGFNTNLDIDNEIITITLPTGQAKPITVINSANL